MPKNYIDTIYLFISNKSLRELTHAQNARLRKTHEEKIIQNTPKFQFSTALLSERLEHARHKNTTHTCLLLPLISFHSLVFGLLP